MACHGAVGVGLVEAESRGFPALNTRETGVNDGVRETAGASHQGHGPVTQAVELVQPTGLETRGHEKGVAAGLDAVSAVFVIADEDADPIRVGTGGGQQGILRRLLPGPLENELGIGVRQQARQYAQNQIRPLLLHQPPDMAEDQRLLVARQAELPL
jgi:hypothetical protein